MKIHVVALELLYVDRWIEMLKHIFGQLALQMYQKWKIINFNNTTMSWSPSPSLMFSPARFICNLLFSWVQINCENRTKQITFLAETTTGPTHSKCVCVCVWIAWIKNCSFRLWNMSEWIWTGVMPVHACTMHKLIFSVLDHDTPKLSKKVHVFGCLFN